MNGTGIIPTMFTLITRTHGQRAHLLCRAGETILKQTYPTIEWIVVEDGSALAAEVLASFPQRAGLTIKHFPIAKAGRSVAANVGLDAARGEFVGFLDDDDELFPNHVETLVNLLNKYPSAAGAYAAAVQTHLHLDGSIHSEQIFLRAISKSTRLIFENLFPIQAVAFRSRYRQRQQFDTNLDALEDWLFWLQLFIERKIVWTPTVTSRFYMPLVGSAIQDQRSQEHTDAYAYFSLQREGLFQERERRDVRAIWDGYMLRTSSLLLEALYDPEVVNSTQDHR